MDAKKWIASGLAAATVSLAAVGTFMPGAREYIINITKELLSAIPGMMQ